MGIKQVSFTDKSTGMRLTLDQTEIKSIKQSSNKDMYYINTYNGNFISNYIMWEVK